MNELYPIERFVHGELAVMLSTMTSWQLVHVMLEMENVLAADARFWRQIDV